MAKLDDASWHYGGEFPDDLPDEAGATHIGMFLAWALLAGLGAEEDPIFDDEELRALRERTTTPGRFLISACDEKFVGEELSEEGEEFARGYYEERYTGDYFDLLAEDLESVYHVPDTWETFDRLASLLDRRLAEWRAGGGGG